MSSMKKIWGRGKGEISKIRIKNIERERINE